MPRRILLGLVLSSWIGLAVFGQQAADPPMPFVGKVVRVADGDTITVLLDKQARQATPVIAILAWQSFAQERTKGIKEPIKDVVFEDELVNADLKDTVLQESFRKLYTVKLDKHRLYQITLTSKVFAPHVRLETAAREQIDAAAIGKSGSTSIYHRPAKTDEYEIIVTSQNSGAMGRFTLVVKEIPGGSGEPIEVKNENGKGAYEGRLINSDPNYRGGKKHKMLLFKMEDGKTYQIEMTSKAFDSYLFLESPAGKYIAEDDDGGGFPTARIVHKAAETGLYRIACTYFAPAIGDFRVTIRQLE